MDGSDSASVAVFVGARIPSVGTTVGAVGVAAPVQAAKRLPVKRMISRLFKKRFINTSTFLHQLDDHLSLLTTPIELSMAAIDTLVIWQRLIIKHGLERAGNNLVTMRLFVLLVTILSQ